MTEQRLPSPPVTDGSPAARWFTDIWRVVNRLVARPTTLKLAFTAGAVNTTVLVNHGLMQSKIVGSSIFIKTAADELIPAFSNVAGFTYTYKITATQVSITVPTGATTVASRPGTILLFHEG